MSFKLEKFDFSRKKTFGEQKKIFKIMEKNKVMTVKVTQLEVIDVSRSSGLHTVDD
jgi:hypothetical protein